MDKSPGLDGIHPKVLKDTGINLFCFLLYLISEKFLKEGYCWWVKKIKLCHKFPITDETLICQIIDLSV